MDVWLGEEVGHSFVHAIFKAVSHTLSCSLHNKFIAVLMKTVTGAMLCVILYVKTTLILLNIQQRPALPLHSARFFQPTFEPQYAPDVPASIMTF
ncbi:hypothetical protein P692DRAFT_20597984 [Suillus brevipes Sb2]|nr:hypothetical protein P692DRAFT_20597984 [Suillus brevipes Sb2]